MPVFLKQLTPCPLRVPEQAPADCSKHRLVSLQLLNSVGKHFRLAELTKQLQSSPKPRSRDLQSISQTETLASFTFTGHFFGKALQRMEFSWNLEGCTGTSSASELNSGWQSPLIFMTKKKKHCGNSTFRSDAGLYSSMTLMWAIIQNKWFQ